MTRRRGDASPVTPDCQPVPQQDRQTDTEDHLGYQAVQAEDVWHERRP